jgi:hypothetical protein
MTEQEFAIAVMAGVPVVDETDRGIMTAHARDLFREGYTVADAAALIRCTEESNPDLGEAVALRRMAAIRRKYAKGGGQG